MRVTWKAAFSIGPVVEKSPVTKSNKVAPVLASIFSLNSSKTPGQSLYGFPLLF